MTNPPKKNLIFSAIFLAAFFLSFNFIFKPDSLKNFFYKNSFSFQSFLRDKSQAAIAFSQGYFFSYKLEEENQRLLKQNQELLAKSAELAALSEENNALRQALDSGAKENFALFPCQMVLKESAGDFLMVSAGEKQGVKTGQVVLSQEGSLVGRVEEVYEDFSRIMLISNTKSAAGVEIEGKDFYALAKGQGNLKLILDLVEKNKNVEEGDLLATSALGGIFPSGIALGKVSKIQSQAAASFLQIEIEPLFRIENLNNLFIIKNFKPLN